MVPISADNSKKGPPAKVEFKGQTKKYFTVTRILPKGLETGMRTIKSSNCGLII